MLDITSTQALFGVGGSLIEASILVGHVSGALWARLHLCLLATPRRIQALP